MAFPTVNHVDQEWKTNFISKINAGGITRERGIGIGHAKNTVAHRTVGKGDHCPQDDFLAIYSHPFPSRSSYASPQHSHICAQIWWITHNVRIIIVPGKVLWLWSATDSSFPRGSLTLVSSSELLKDSGKLPQNNNINSGGIPCSVWGALSPACCPGSLWEACDPHCVSIWCSSQPCLVCNWVQWWRENGATAGRLRKYRGRWLLAPGQGCLHALRRPMQLLYLQTRGGWHRLGWLTGGPCTVALCHHAHVRCGRMPLAGPEYLPQCTTYSNNCQLIMYTYF